jgi:microcystin-dependent protein
VEPFIGEIRMMAFDYAPRGWWRCDGTLLDIHQNETLHSLIGTTYGGDGQTTFALPKLEPFQGVKPYIALEGIYPQRN